MFVFIIFKLSPKYTHGPYNKNTNNMQKTQK